MILVLDGYNILKQVTSTTTSEKERLHFINQLARYAKIKGHTVVVVFDGGPTTWPSQELIQGVVVMYAGTRLSADDYIKQYMQAHKRREVLLVSSDRQLCLWVANLQIESMDAIVFYRLMHAVVEEHTQQAPSKGNSVVKTTTEKNSEVDALMEDETSSYAGRKSEIEYTYDTRKRPSRRLSKGERQIMKKIKKL